MKLTVLDPNNTPHWMEVHAAGCADLKKMYRGVYRGYGSWALEADNLTDATWAIASDFIAERDEPEAESVADFRDHEIHWAPCVTLPKEAPQSAAQSDYDQVVADIQANWDQYRAGTISTKTYLRGANTLHAQLAEAMYLVEGTD